MLRLGMGRDDLFVYGWGGVYVENKGTHLLSGYTCFKWHSKYEKNKWMTLRLTGNVKFQHNYQ